MSPALRARTRDPLPLGAGRRRGVVRALAAAALLLGTAAACKPTPEPGQTPAPTEGPAIAITGECAGEQTIEPAAQTGPKDWAAVAPPERTPCFRLSATAADPRGNVALDTAFVLESATALKPDEVKALLTVSPPLDIEVTKDKPVTADASATNDGAVTWLDRLARTAHAQSLANRYRITTKAPLAPGVVYRFDLKASTRAPKTAQGTGAAQSEAPALRSWAFQAAAPLAVVHTLPADRTTFVPTDTGIELTFNQDGVDPDSVETRFSIEPPVEGRFEMHKRTAVFVPTRLLTGTLYTVRLAAGVTGRDAERTAEPTVFRFQTRRPEAEGPTDARDFPALEFRRPVWESPTDTAPVIGLFRRVGEDVPLERADVQVWRYESTEAFAAALGRYASMPRWADVSGARTLDNVGASPAFTFTTPIAGQGDFGEIALPFPEPLEAGAYRVSVTVDGFPVPAGGWLQVTDVAAYTAVSDGKLIVWANDLSTGKPLAGATVSANGGAEAGTTGKDGVAFVETPADILTVADAGTDWAHTATTGTLAVAAPDGRVALVPLGDAFFANGGGYREFRFGMRATGGRYWRYLYTDRQLYRLSDTVHFWGVARARDGAEAVEKVTVEITGGDWSAYDYRPVAIASTTVVPDAAGVFSGELTFTGASPSYYTLKMRVGNEVIAQTPLSVEDVVLPAYRIEVETSRRALMAGESVSATARAAFFDGTPVVGADVIASHNGQDRTLTTGDDGSVSWSFQAPARVDASSQGFESVYLLVHPAGGEEGDIGANAQLSVFSAERAIQAEGVIAGGGADPISRTATVSGTVHALDVSRLNGRVLANADDFYGATVADAAVSVRVTETEQVRIETGERYDFQAKKVVKTYRYDAVSRAIGPYAARSGEDGGYRVTFPARGDRSYEALVETEDDAGRVAARRIWLGTLYLGDPGEPLLLTSPDDNASSGKAYRVGETVHLQVSGGVTATSDARYLFVRARNGLLDYTLQDDAAYAFGFEEAHVPNVHTLAARFDGRSYRETVWGHDARYDSTQRRLSIAVMPERAAYLPGETATVGVTVTDVAGKPVADASVLVSAVDAAILAAQGDIERPDPVAALYESAPAGVLRTYTSHVLPRGEMGAEGGGGGGERSLFEDVAVFASLTTDRRGRATTTFALPDNLTSWVLTSLAATKDLRAGNGFGILTVSKPLFVDATLNRTYVTADAPQIRLRTFGAGLGEGGPVTYSLTSDTLLPTAIDVGGEAFVPTLVPLGPLPAGTHRLRITARAGDLEDTLLREVTVLPSRLSHAVAETKVLQKGDTADLSHAGEGAVQVVIADANRGGLYGDVATLADAPSGRLDDTVARAVAQDLLATAFGEPVAVPVDLRSTTYQTTTGGLSLFPYSEPDVALSADVAMAAPDRFGRQSLAQFFRAALDAKADVPRSDAVTALRGLAALGEPVLADVKALLDAGPTLDAPLTVLEQLDLGLAAALLGDLDGAETAYRAVLGDHGQARGTSARIDAGTDADDVVIATARAAVLGALLGDDLAPAFHDYARSNPAKDAALAVWHAAYLRAALPRLASQSATLRYTLPGGEENVTLEPGQSVVLHLTAAMRKALDLRVDDGAVSVTVVHREAFTAATGAGDPDLSLQRSYGGRSLVPPPVGPDGEPTEVEAAAEALTPPDAVGSTASVTSTAPVSASALIGALTALDEGALVTVTLTPRLGPKAAAGCYQVSDLLPSGLRPATARFVPGGYQPDVDVVHPYAIEGQRVSFCVWPDEDGQVRPIRYLARAFAPGRYAAEPAVIQAQSAPDRQALSAPAAVEIRPRGAAVP